jgi:hypothetical protein
MARGALEEGFNQIKLAHKLKHNLNNWRKKSGRISARISQRKNTSLQ